MSSIGFANLVALRFENSCNNFKTRSVRRDVAQTCCAQGGQWDVQRVIGVAAMRQQLFQQIAKRPYFKALQSLGVMLVVRGDERRSAEIPQHCLVATVQNVVRIQVAVHQPTGVQVLRSRRDAVGDGDDLRGGEGGVGGIHITRA